MPYSSEGYSNSNLFSSVRHLYRVRGLGYLIRKAFWYLIDMYFSSFYYNKFRSSETFQFQGKDYHYVFQRYCTTWKNERCVVLPIAWDILSEYQKRGKKILEVGNVTSYTYPIVHDVIDKYENTKRIMREDVVEFKTSKQYDLIFSIVTMQHIGYNESPRDPKKVLRAMQNLKNILAHNGKIVILHGMGENKEMDELIKNGLLGFERQYYLMKVSGYKWKEAGWEDVKDLPYDYWTPSARGIVVGIYEKI